jgi:hypothetical protein
LQTTWTFCEGLTTPWRHARNVRSWRKGTFRRRPDRAFIPRGPSYAFFYSLEPVETNHGCLFTSANAGSNRCRRAPDDNRYRTGASTGAVPQPQRPGRGGTDHGPRNLMRDQENPDLLVPPSTDSGTLPNLRFSFSDAHMRLETGGWTRQVTSRELGVAKEMAGVNMRLNAGGVRELHCTRLPNGPTCFTARPA